MEDVGMGDLFRRGAFLPSDKLVYLSLRSEAKGAERVRLTVRSISYATGLNELTIHKAIRRLTEKKVIAVRRLENVSGRPNEYQFVTEDTQETNTLTEGPHVQG